MGNPREDPPESIDRKGTSDQDQGFQKHSIYIYILNIPLLLLLLLLLLIIIIMMMMIIMIIVNQFAPDGNTSDNLANPSTSPHPGGFPFSWHSQFTNQESSAN